MFLKSFVLHMAISNKNTFLNISISAIDGTLTGINTPGHNGPVSNSKNGITALFMALVMG